MGRGRSSDRLIVIWHQSGNIPERQPCSLSDANLRPMPELDLKPASQADVIVYTPYYQGVKKESLPLAIGVYQKGNLEGERPIEGGQPIPFVATWTVSKLPSDLTICSLQFSGSAELGYEISMINSEFINYLIEVVRGYQANKTIDFSQEFYRRLLRIDEINSSKMAKE